MAKIWLTVDGLHHRFCLKIQTPCLFSAQILKYCLFVCLFPPFSLALFPPVDNHNSKWDFFCVCACTSYWPLSFYLSLYLISYIFYLLIRSGVEYSRVEEHRFWHQINLNLNPGVTICKQCDLTNHLTSLIMLFSSVKCRDWCRLKGSKFLKQSY